MPTIDSWRSTAPSGSRPSAASSAIARGRARAAGRAVGLAVGEDRDVALVGPRPGRGRRRGSSRRRPRAASSLGWRATSAASSAHLISRPSAISSPRCSGVDREAGGGRRQRRVDRAAVGDVDRVGRRGRPTAAGEHVGGHVAEVTAAIAPPSRTRARDPARGDVDRELDLAVSGGLDAAGLDGPRGERDRAVPARGREAVLVPEQHAELGAVVVGLHEEAAVHVGVPARLVAQQPAHALRVRVVQRALAALGDGGAGQLRRALE